MRKTTMLIGLLVAGLLAGPLWAADEGAAQAAKHKVIVVVEKDGKVLVQGDVKGQKEGADKPRVHVKTLRLRPKPGEGRIEKKAAAASGDGWLGVRLTPVPAAVAAHLGLKGKGAMIANLVKGAPADKAGLDRYDVIVGVGKDESVGGVEEIISAVKAHKPDEKLPLTFLHEGRKKSLTVTLGKPIAWDAAEYVYKEDPDDQWQDAYNLYKGMLQKGPKGWTFVTPGKGTVRLPEIILESLPKHPWANVQVRVGGGGGKHAFSISRTIDGKTIKIEARDGEPVVVTRTEPGTSATKKYKDADELRQKDAEAYELYKNAHTPGKGPYTYQFTYPGKSAREAAEQAAEKIRQGAEQQAREIERQMKAWAEKAKGEAHVAQSKIKQALGEQVPARHQFEVDEKGRIKVQVREGDSAAKLTFENEEEMQKKAPALYKAYQKLLKGQ
jgi:ElaB/YqjD/DUF883 family membrane-anchored ribosome-binding protein